MAGLVSASRAQWASGPARLARRVADALAGAIPPNSASTPTPATLKSSGGSWRPFCPGRASRLRSRNAPSVCSATQAWHVSARHGTYRWTASSPSCMKAATRVTPRGPQRGSRPCPGIIGERYDGRAAMIGQQFSTYPTLRAALDVLSGWGPVTIQLFPRELRGVWPGRAAVARPARRVRRGHLGHLGPGPARLPQRLSASPGWPPGVTRAAGIWKAAWSGSPWRITARGWGLCPGRHLCVLFS